MNATPQTKPRVLCVDDEPQILEGLLLTLRRHYDVSTAVSAAAGLEALGRESSTAVILSDMRMPSMDGAAFLVRARQTAPDAVRMLLTGHADIEAAIAAVNEGQIFRFLTKPCPPPTLLAAVAAAVEQHRLVSAERVLLEQTLHGSIKVLTDVLAIVSPISFGRATRIKHLVTELADKLAIRERWEVEVAAMLSQLGFITLSAETAEKAYYGGSLSADDQKEIARLPLLTEELLGNIPRLEGVRELLKSHSKPPRPEVGPRLDPRKAALARGAQLLRVAVDFDALETEDTPSARRAALDAMRGRVGQYDVEILQALTAIRAADKPIEVRELHSSDLRVGMVLADDVKLPGGALLAARGYEITGRFLDRIRQSKEGAVRKATWRVLRAEPPPGPQ